MTDNESTPRDLARLVALVKRLRAPDGCPWDQEQTISDLRAYLLEEAHETAAAIDALNFGSRSSSEATLEPWTHLEEELGDLLFQVAFAIQLATEVGAFDMAGVITRIEDKMIERHPHVFGTKPDFAAPGTSQKSEGTPNPPQSLEDADAVRRAWERRKLDMRSTDDADRSLLDGVASSLPALAAAYRMSQKAAGVGFDWPDAEAVFTKIDEELDELREALEIRDQRRSVTSSESSLPSDDQQEVRGEIGDLLLTVANLARKLGIDPEGALAESNLKFRRRFGHIERRLRDDGRTANDSDLDEMETLWREAKSLENENF